MKTYFSKAEVSEREKEALLLMKMRALMRSFIFECRVSRVYFELLLLKVSLLQLRDINISSRAAYICAHGPHSIFTVSFMSGCYHNKISDIELHSNEINNSLNSFDPFF